MNVYFEHWRDSLSAMLMATALLGQGLVWELAVSAVFILGGSWILVLSDIAPL